MAVPALREELALLPGPRLPDGQPSWTLHDPVRNLFFQLDWPSFELLRRWALRDPQRIAQAVQCDTVLDPDSADVERLSAFLQANQLVQPPAGAAPRLRDALQQARGSLLHRLLHNYLFLRIPLVRPDAWLTRWAPRLDFLFTRGFLGLTLLAALLGVVSVVRDWTRFSATLVDLLSWQGIVAYGLTLTAVKTLHELGHAFTAKRFGCRVPTMGLAFMVLWPVAYTDTNEVWKLTCRRQRVQVAAAGIATELAVAAWATLAWAWLPEGGARTAAFLLSTTTWVSTLLVNASPFMRFDGYFLLADAVQLPNLHARSFALARWHLRERLFALGEPAPEPFAPPRRTALVLFAYATWAYRLVLFLGIAVLVYHFFIKAVGMALFAVELAWFIGVPLAREARAWRERWPVIRTRRRARVTGGLLLLLGGLFLAPWPTRVTTSALLRPQDVFVVYAPRHARITAWPHRDGSRVQAGAPLVAMESPDLQVRSRQADARRTQLAWQSASAGFDAEQRKQWLVLGERLATAEAEARTVAADAARYAPVAPYAGVLHVADPDLRAGDWVAQDEVLAHLVREGPPLVVTYVDDEDVQRVATGDRALFVSDGPGGPVLQLEVARIDRDASRTLPEAELAAPFGGHVAVRERNGVLYPERAAYRVVLHVTGGTASPQHTWRGRVAIAAAWEAPGMRFVRSAAQVVLRESGF